MSQLADLKQPWEALDGAGAHVMAVKGPDFGQTLSNMLQGIAQQRAGKYGVSLEGLVSQDTQRGIV